MSKVYLVMAITMVGVLSSMKLDPKNPPTGQTGAPGETTCSTANGCHNGGTYTGEVEITGLSDTIFANTEYSLSLVLSSDCVRTGFEITVLDKANKKCGDLIAGTNCNLRTVGTKQYLRQSNPVNLANKTASYSFKWKSPATIDKDSAFFYFVMLQSNNNGNTSGDNAAKGLKKVVMPTLSNTSDEINASISIYPNPAADFINITLPSNEETSISIADYSGKIVYSTKVNASAVLNVKDLNAGVYFIKLKSKKINLTKKIMIQ
jgi:hypothetical protein